MHSWEERFYDCDNTFFCFDFGPGLSAAAGGFLGGSVGGILGLVGGSAYRKHMIYRDQPSYEAFKRKMLNGTEKTNSTEKDPVAKK